jgi:prophage tail gpP-like protein
MTSDLVTLKVGRKIYSGWTDIAIDMSLTEISDSFSVSITDLFPGQQKRFQVQPGNACSLAIGDDTLITGYINDVEISYDTESHSLFVRGRDKTGDLVDCSATPHGFGNWNRVSIMDIAKVLLDPFGITVTSTVPDTAKAIRGHTVQMGETVWECLDRAFRQYGVMAMADGSGNLVLTRPGDGGALAEARLGGIILAGSASYSGRETFKDYYVLGQFPGGNDAYSDPSVTTMASAHVTDPNVTRFRPLIVHVECNTSDMAFLPTRAAWEAAYRSGKGRRFQITVQGWRDANGKLYAPNTMIRLEDDFLGVHESLLVVAVHLSLSESGTLAGLTLSRKDAFIPAPLTSLPPYENGTGAKP